MHDSASIAATPPENAVARAERFFDLQLSFNLFPATYVHPSWIQHMGLADEEEGCSPATAAPFWTRCLSSSLLRAWRLEAQFDCDFFDPAKRLALIDAADLIRIGGLAGAVLMRDRLRGIVDRTEVDALRRGIGAEAQRFALKWNAESPELAHAPIWKLAFDGPLPDVETWAVWSASLVMAAIPPIATGVLGRLQLKFPRDWSQLAGARLRLPESERASLVALLLAVIRTDAGQWTWLFEAAAPVSMAS